MHNCFPLSKLLIVQNPWDQKPIFADEEVKVKRYPGLQRACSRPEDDFGSHLSFSILLSTLWVSEIQQWEVFCDLYFPVLETYCLISRKCFKCPVLQEVEAKNYSLDCSAEKEEYATLLIQEAPAAGWVKCFWSHSASCGWSRAVFNPSLQPDVSSCDSSCKRIL